MNFRSQRALVGSLMVAVCLGCFSPTACWAQKRYKDPFADKVVKIADKAARFLESDRGGGRAGPICALALLEYYKRYEGAVPTDNRYISSVAKRIADMADSGSDQVFKNRETYFPALAMIFLAEYDAKKYKPQIIKILDALIERQLPNGGFTYSGEKVGDTSQSQFGALAFYVAHQHRIPLDPKHVERLLQFYVDYQADSGTWSYKPRLGEGSNVNSTNSLHSASLSSVYLLADMLRLSRRVKNMANVSADSSLGLPKNVSVYIPPTDDKEGELQAAWGDGTSPVVKFEKGKLASCKSSGNSWYSSQFQFPISQWNSYFMYALERYAYFKEQADGNLGSSVNSWYDDGVDYIEEYQSDSGAVEGHFRVQNMPLNVNTAFSLLFLVRASEIISLPPTTTELLGGEGFEAGTLTQSKAGTIASSEAEKSLKGLIDSLSDDTLDDRQLQQITQAMKRAVREFKTKGKRSRGEITSFLKTMISEKNYYRRLVAIRFLSGEQDMDNVPALLYAMGDPDETIAVQAHNGLRLISRKFDTFVFEDKGNKQDNLLELTRLKQQWTKWYLDIRPDAELLE